MTPHVPELSPGLSEFTLERLAATRHVAILTAAGMSADSGTPTYRSGVDALWSSAVVNEVASASAWRQQPLKVWAWYMAMRGKVIGSQPNAGHLALARLAESVQVTVLAQKRRRST
jgi:NAD-dependent deacetylase